MKLIDLNLLIYAINSDAPNHDKARLWWEDCLSGDEAIGIPWIVILGFLRITTNPKVMARPLSPQTAMAIVEDWLMQPPVQIPAPTESHWNILQQLIEVVGVAGNLTSDAHLAALAIQYGATLCSADYDFGRFKHLKWHNPLVDK